MTRIGSCLLGCLVAAMAVAGCGGSSHDKPTAAVCATLRSDALHITSTPPTNASQAAGALKSAAKTFDTDVADAKDASLRTAIRRDSATLSSVAAALPSAGTNKTKLAALAQRLQTAEASLSTECPAPAGSPSASPN